jgi:hypothetical protein
VVSHVDKSLGRHAAAGRKGGTPWRIDGDFDVDDPVHSYRTVSGIMDRTLVPVRGDIEANGVQTIKALGSSNDSVTSMKDRSVLSEWPAEAIHNEGGR